MSTFSRSILQISLVGSLALGAWACDQGKAPTKAAPTAKPKATTKPAPTSKPMAVATATPVDFKSWSKPEVACVLMDNNQLPTDGYQKVANPKWSCASKPRGVGQGGIEKNTIVYSATGTETQVAELKLVLQVKEAKHEGNARGQLRVLGDALTRRVYGESMPAEYTKAVQDGKAGKWTVGGAAVELASGDGAGGPGLVLTFRAK